jgi:hypothetical protein
MKKKFVSIAAGISLLGTVLAFSAGSASAWPSYVDYPAQEMRYNYHSYAYKAAQGGDAGGPHGVGSERNFYDNIQNLANYNFVEYGPGQGTSVKNHAGSVYNISGQYVDVFYNSYGVMGCWCGTHDRVGWGGKDLTSTLKNNNASHHATTINSY